MHILLIAAAAILLAGCTGNAVVPPPQLTRPDPDLLEDPRPLAPLAGGSLTQCTGNQIEIRRGFGDLADRHRRLQAWTRGVVGN